VTDQLQAFADALLRDWPGNLGVEGYDLIHIAVHAGLLVETTARRPCGDQCRCAGVYDPAEWPQGVTCYRVNPELRGTV